MTTIDENNPVDAIAESARAGRLIIFCGAGVSMLPPSRSPSWWDIYSAAAHALADQLNNRFPKTAELLEVNALLAPLATQELADLVFSRFAGPTFAELLNVVDVADPNENHRSIVSLIEIGCVPAIITTNFDTLIERAGSIRNVSMTIAAPGVSARPHPADACVLIKIHGTTVDTQTIIETSTHKAREVSPTLRAAWANQISGADLLVLGYSGADLNFGAAREFFSDFLEQGRHIYWPHLPGRKPELPRWVQSRVTLFEGSLPFPLREVREKLGASDFQTPQYNRDAHATLAEAMNSWSREPHIGPWAAATFYLNLAERSGAQGQALLERILQIAREEIINFQPGGTISISEFGAAGFFGAAGMMALQKVLQDDAESFQRVAVSIYNNIDKVLGEKGDESDSYQERHSNLASAWNNLAHTQMMKGDRNSGLSSFARGLHEAYLAGTPSGFLPSLYNILHYGFELNDVRRCMQLGEAALRLADRFGIVTASIELRILLAMYAHDRNELWIASEWLREASRRAVAINDHKSTQVVGLMLGENEIRTGKTKEGLTRIAGALEKLGEVALFLRPIEELRRYLVVLGIDQPPLFLIRLETDSIAEHVAAIEEVRGKARDCRKIPWEGAHCRISKSAVVNEDAMRPLFQLGLHEFDGEYDLAVQLGLNYAEVLLSRGEHFEARWAARNVLFRPETKTRDRARAHTAIALAAASLGFLDEARDHLDTAVDEYRKDGEELPPTLTWTGLWFHVQCENVEKATRWAVRRVASCGLTLVSELRKDVLRLYSWGESMADAANIIRDHLEQLGESVESDSRQHSSHPFRPFSGETQQQAPTDEEVSRVIYQAELSLQQGDSKSALAALDSLSEKESIPEHQAGVVMAHQMQAMAPSLSLERLEALAAFQRERLVSQLRFTALSQVEASLMWALVVQHQDHHRAADLLRRRGWVGELAADPVARASLLTWEAFHPLLADKSIISNPRIRTALGTSRYFDLPEAALAQMAAGLTDEQPDKSLSAKLAIETQRALGKAFSEVSDSNQADRALAEAVKTLRKARAIDRVSLARMRGDRANWALRNNRFSEAAAIFRKVQRSFRLLGRIDDALNAMAGEARSLSRSGHYDEAVDLFREAIDEAQNRSIQTNLLLGLGSAHLLEGTEHRVPPDPDLIHEAADTLRQAVQSAPARSIDQSMAKLALARSLGENAEQKAALDLFDEAVAELAHLGDPRAKLLQENRNQLVAGKWRVLTLA